MLVDAWAHRAGESGPNDKNSPEEATHAARYEAAMAATEPYATRRDVRRGLSAAVAATVADGALDFVYLDALHTAEAVAADLRAWYPKVRRCGLVSGDDYGDAEDTPFYASLRGARLHGPTARNFEWGVIRAVQNFTAALGVELHVTFGQDCYKHPAWYFVKPA